MRFFLGFCAFFIFSPTIIFAQVFTPEKSLFKSQLDGAWEFYEPQNYEIKKEIFLEYSENIKIKKTEHVFNNPDNFLVNNKLSIDFISQLETSFGFSFLCETEEMDSGFDNPFFLVYLNSELIFKESDFSECGNWKEKYFLLSTKEENRIDFFAGNNGDLQKNTVVKIKDIKLFKKEVLKEIIPTSVPTNKPKQIITNKIIEKQSYSPVIHSFNEKPEIKGEVLGETTEIKGESGWKEFIPEYFPLLLGVVVFIFSFYFFIILSDWIIKLREERKK
jgi:hypothetical protein